MIVNIVNEWQIATAVNGNEINVRIVPHVRKQNSLDGYRWVEVGKKIQLQNAGFNQLYRLNTYC
ncbi:transposase [Acinetobacter baumannii]|uniref:transposase n=1 Tax=Acinetobacter baumannii TaxID=470 RepID=UPI001AECF994|nr:transposase [Acinetobacter baumannii]MBP2983264.1 transposase [Acinetobacter baumannii]